MPIEIITEIIDEEEQKKIKYLPETINPTNYLDNFCVGKKSRNYPDPTDCHKYIVCNGHYAVSMTCPSKLWYNFKKDICDWPENVDCKPGK